MSRYPMNLLFGIPLCVAMALLMGDVAPANAVASRTTSPLLAQVDVQTWSKIITDIGILSGLVFFFTFTAWKREERLASRITALETFTQQDLIACTKTCTETIISNTKAVGELVNCLTHRPCLLETVHLKDELQKLVNDLRMRIQADVNMATCHA